MHCSGNALIQKTLVFCHSFLDPTWIEDLKATYSQDVNIQEILLKLQEGKLYGKGYSFRNGLLFKNGRIFLG